MEMIFGILAATIPLCILGAVIYAVVTFVSKHKDSSGNVVPYKPHALDAMYYFGMFVTLSATISSLLTIIFAAIDHRFKDALELPGSYNVLQVGDDVRIAVAVLFVAFPIYLVLAWLSTSRIAKDQERLQFPIRYIYTYGIIIVTAITLAGTLISIIYKYLSGELFVRFAPKSFVLFAIGLVVLGYHIYLLKRDYKKATKLPLVFTILSIVFVIGSVVYGIAETGSPAKVRALKFDDRRIQDLSTIQQAVLNKWQRDGILPENTTSLNDQLQGTILPVDPKTKLPYEYRVIQNSKVVEKKNAVTSNTDIPGAQTSTKVATTDAIFEICATFETERNVGKVQGLQQADFVYTEEISASYRGGLAYYYPGDTTNPTWDHKAERACFTRTISKDKYQILGI